MILPRLLRSKRTQFQAVMNLSLQHIRFKSITGYETADKALQTVTGGRVDRWLNAYENFVGLTEVRNAQEHVTKAESKYRDVQEERRAIQQQLTVIQSQIKAVAADIDKTTRGTDAYVDLVTKENEIIREEKKIVDELVLTEENEKQLFSALSSALRESHEKERARAERMKYWSIIGSVVGAVIGIFGTTVNNHFRMKELRNIVSSSAETGQEYRDQTVQLCAMLDKQYNTIEEFLVEIKTHLLPSSKVPVIKSKDSKVTHTSVHSDTKLDEIVGQIKKQSAYFETEMKELRQILATGNSHPQLGQVVYVGPEIQELFKETESKLERRMNYNTAVYTAVAMTVIIVLTVLNATGN